MELSYVNKHLLVLALAQVCLISKFQRPSSVLICVYYCFAILCASKWHDFGLVILCLRPYIAEVKHGLGPYLCASCVGHGEILFLSNSVGGSCLETRTCQVVLRLVWLVALRHRISATYSCGTRRLVLGELWSWHSANMSNTTSLFLIKVDVWLEGTRLISLLGIR